MEIAGEGQGLAVVAFEMEGGEDGQGEDDAGGDFGLGVVLVAHEGQEVVYNAEGRYSAHEHSGHHFFLN